MPHSFHHKVSIQIRFKDIDALGHVNNANFLSYLEIARISYFNEVIKENINWSQKGIILAKASINYKVPLRLTDHVMVKVGCSKIGTKSFEMAYSVVKLNGEEEIEVADAVTVMVCFDYTEGKSMEMPTYWKEQLMKFEKIN